MMRRMICVLLCLVMVMAMVPGTVFATGTMEICGGAQSDCQVQGASMIVASGTCGEGVTWTRDDDGVLTISGSGAVDDEAFRYDKTIKRLIVEPGVTAIGTYAFDDCSYLVDVTLPEGLQRIGDYAFSDCLVLTGVTLPQGLQMLETGTFFGCGSLVTVTLPVGLAYVENSVFYECGSLEEVIFLGAAPSIADRVFSSGSQQVIYYPEDEITWNDTTKLSYGGSPRYKALGTASELRVTVEDAQYRAGERVDAHLTVDLVYGSGAVSRVPGGEVQFGDVDMTVPGPKTLTVSACGFQQQCQILVHDTVTIDTSSITRPSFDCPVGDDTDDTQVLTVPGADVVEITFTASTYVSTLYVYDGQDALVAQFDYDVEAGAKKVKVPGDTVKIRIISDWGGEFYAIYALEAYSVEHVFPDGGTECAICAGTLVCEHSYADGACTICGGADPDYGKVVQPSLTMKYPSLSFEAEIQYNVYFLAENTDDVVEMGLATFATELTDGTVENATDVIEGFDTDGTLWKVGTNGIPAKALGDTLYFKVYAKLTDGSYVYSEMKSYDAVSYANTILGRDTSSEYMKSLVVAMLNYGAEAQKYFGHGTDDLMDAGLTEEQQTLSLGYDESMMDAVVEVDSAKASRFIYDGGSFTRRAPTVSFDGAFSINYYFTAANAPDDGMKLYYWSMEDYEAASVLTLNNATGSVEMVATDVENQFWGQVPDIAAKELDRTVFVVGVYQCDGLTYTTGVLNYSIGKYCVGLAADEGSQQQDLAKATAVYGYHAKEYFGDL